MCKVGSRKLKTILALLFLFSQTSLIRAERWDVQVSYGGWTLSPFVSPVERESERMIKEEFIRLLNPFLPENALSSFLSQVDLSSSGKFLALAAWYNFGQGRFSLGVKGQYFDFRVPYTISSKQTISFLGFQLADLETQGKGEVELGSLMVSLLARWGVLSLDKFTMSLYGGLTLMPFNGNFRLEGKALLLTPLGNLEYQGGEEQTIEQLREWNGRTPSWLFSPSLGFLLQYRLTKELGILLDAALSQGTVFSAGLYFSL